jgi:hypothetical protein
VHAARRRNRRVVESIVNGQPVPSIIQQSTFCQRSVLLLLAQAIPT